MVKNIFYSMQISLGGFDYHIIVMNKLTSGQLPKPEG